MQNKRIKILRIIARLNIGGPAIHATLLTREFNNDEFESRLLCGAISKGEGDMGYIAEEYGVSPIYVPQLKRELRPFQDLMAFCKIFMYIRKYKPDIIHTHTAKAGALGRLAAFLANVPVKAHTFHGNVFQGYFDKRSTRSFIFIERILAGFSDSIIAISESQKEDIIRKHRITSQKKCHIVKLGFDSERVLDQGRKKNIFREKFNFKKDDILVGIVGRLTAIKNHKMFVNTAGYINKSAGKDLADKIKFAIIGDGEYKDEILAYIKFKKLEGKILFAGWIKNIDEAYAGLDIVVLTSTNEGTPVSLIEAMMASKPVVSTDVGGVRDTVGDIGILVRSGDYTAMGDKILELAASVEKREKLGIRGRELVRDIYSKERLVSELSGLYKELLSKKMERV